MADISTYLANIMSAVYGEEVRGSIHDALQEMNNQLNSAAQAELNALGFRGDLADGMNLGAMYKINDGDDVRYRGIWRILPSRSYSDLPSGFVKANGGLLIVYIYGSHAKQELYYYSGEEPSKYWTRTAVLSGSELSPIAEYGEWQLNDANTSLQVKGNITSFSLDAFNSSDHNGIYKIPSRYSSSLYTLPDGYDTDLNGCLLVLAIGNTVIQKLGYFSGSGANEVTEWSRVYINNAWSSWQKNTDSSLSIEGAAADAKAVGDALASKQISIDTIVNKQAVVSFMIPLNSDLNTVITQGIYRMTSANVPNWPFDTTGQLLVFNALNQTRDAVGAQKDALVQIAITDGSMAYRIYGTNSFGNWVYHKVDNTLSMEGLAADAKAVGDKAVLSKGIASTTDISNPVIDINTFTKSGLYAVETVNTVNWAFGTNYFGTLVVFNALNHLGGVIMPYSVVQMAYSNGEFAYRMLKNGTEWTSWKKDNINELTDALNDILYLDTFQTELTATSNANYYLEPRTSTGCRIKNTTGSELILYSVPVTAKKKYRVIATNVASIGNAILAFSKNAIGDNVNCDMLISNTGGPTIDYSYSPTDNGYLYLSRGTNANMAYNIYEVSNKATLKTDKTLAIENMPADANVTGSRVDNLKHSIYNMLHFSIMAMPELTRSVSNYGVTYDATDHDIHVYGMATASHQKLLFSNKNGMIPGVKAGDVFYVKLYSSQMSVDDALNVFSSGYIRLFIRCFSDETQYTDINISNTAAVQIPQNTVSTSLMLYINSAFNHDIRFYLYCGYEPILSTRISVDPVYKTSLSFEYSSDTFTIESNATGVNMFFVIDEKERYILNYDSVGTRSWTLTYDQDALVYNPVSKQFRIVNVTNDAISSEDVILAFADIYHGVHGLWREYSDQGAIYKVNQFATIVNGMTMDVDHLKAKYSSLDNIICHYNSKLPNGTQTFQGVSYTLIDKDVVHMEGTASASYMWAFNPSNSFIDGIQAGSDYYIYAEYDASLTGRVYFGIRSIYSDGSYSVMSAVYVNDGVGCDSLKVHIDENAIGANVVLYISSGSVVDANIRLSITKAPESEYLNKKIEDIRTELSSDNLPDYYYTNNYFPNRLAAVKSSLDFANGLCFAFITDVHFPANEMKSRLMLKELLTKTPVPFVICGGDIPALFGGAAQLEDSCDTLLSYASTVGHEKWYTVHGNHDLYCRTNATPTVITRKNRKEIYNYMMRTSERFVSNMLPDRMCYCIDIPAQKSRIIMLNTSDMDNPSGGAAVTSEQTTWFANMLTNVENTRIIVISHIPSDPTLGTEGSTMANFQSLMKALKNKTSVTISGTTYSFTNSTNELVCHINGHLHEDTWHNDDGVLAIVTTCDAAYTDDGHGMVKGTITEQAFDVFCINYDTKAIHTIRFGRGQDRAWDYNEGVVI